jgi:glyoxylase-like metal-dependent hydrolase (beta-lactamase superfamily II)
MMTAIRRPGKVNDHTELIDLGMYGFRGITALYLIRGKKRCLIDGGTRTEAGRLIKTLRAMGAFPPDMIIVTHPHYDHAQAIPAMRLEAAHQQKRIEVLASRDAIPLLADASFNDVLGHGPHEAIEDVTPLDDGDTIDLGGITLRVYAVPGHCTGHIALLDEQTKNLFVGDSIGNIIGDHTATPPFMPPTWDPDAFRATIARLKQMDYQSMCLAHYGHIFGSEAKTILDEAVATCDTWWDLFDRNADRLDDSRFIASVVMKEIKPAIPDFKPVSFPFVVLFPLLMAWNRLTGKGPEAVVSLLLRPTIEQLAAGYRIHHGA